MSSAAVDSTLSASRTTPEGRFLLVIPKVACFFTRRAGLLTAAAPSGVGRVSVLGATAVRLFRDPLSGRYVLYVCWCMQQ